MEPNPPENKGHQDTSPADAQQTDSEVLTVDERQYAMFCHFAAFAGLIIPFGSIIGPLVLWLIKKDESAFINYHGKEALNFNITMAFVTIVCFLLMFVIIGFVLLPLVLIAWLVIIIISGVKANDGLYYRYPFSLRLIS